MTGSNWTVEDYSTWRRERVEEAADLARYACYSDLVRWSKSQELRAMLDRVWGDDGEPGMMRKLGRVVHTARAALSRLELRWYRRQPSASVR